MTYSKTTHRLIICDVEPSIIDSEPLKYNLKHELPGLFTLNIHYDRDKHQSLFIDYCQETMHLDIVGTLKNFDVTASMVISYKHQLAPSTSNCTEYIVEWVLGIHKEYSSPKSECYDVF